MPTKALATLSLRSIYRPRLYSESQHRAVPESLACILKWWHLVNLFSASSLHRSNSVLAFTSSTNTIIRTLPDSKAGPRKLLLESIPRWPGTTDLPYYCWAEDFTVAMNLLGYGASLCTDETPPAVSREEDAITLRYICAALTNHTVSTYVAQNYTSGHAAWLYLHKTFALPSLTQASLRDSLSKLAFSPTGDPRLQTITSDRKNTL